MVGDQADVKEVSLEEGGEDGGAVDGVTAVAACED